MKRTQHAQEMTQRFRELVENAGHSLDEAHYKELALLIEAGIDTALVEVFEKIADKLDKMSHDIRHSAEFFE
jgi:hypothetical protein